MYAPLASLFGPVRVCGCEFRYGMWPFRKRQSFAEVERFEVIHDFPGVRAANTTGIAFFLRSNPVRQFLTGSEYLRAPVRKQWVCILEETRARCVSEDVD
jgi:hypothetical protein